METFIQQLELLRQDLPEPFAMTANLDKFYSSPVARKLIAGKEQTVKNILEYIGGKPAPYLVVPSVLLLSFFDPSSFYKDLLQSLGRAGRPVIEAFEHGFWRIHLDEEQMAGDLINVVHSSGNAAVLLLLQRPVVKKFKEELRAFIESRKSPFDLYAMYCYKYALANDDAVFLHKLSGPDENPEIVSLAREYLISMGE